MSKSPRQRKLEILKNTAAGQKLARKLTEEKQVTLVQNVLQQAELAAARQRLVKLKAQRAYLESRRDLLQKECERLTAETELSEN
jgi:hypothetical protein